MKTGAHSWVILLVLITSVISRCSAQVPGEPQVVLKVRVASLNRSRLRELGANVFEGESGLDFLRSSGTNIELNVPVMDPLLLDAVGQSEVSRVLAAPNLATVTPIVGAGVLQFSGTGMQLETPDNRGHVIDDVQVFYGKGGVRLALQPEALQSDMIRLSVMPEIAGFLGGANADIKPTAIDFNLPVARVPGIKNSSVAGGIDLNLAFGLLLPSGVEIQAGAGYMLLATDIGSGVSASRNVWNLGFQIAIPLGAARLGQSVSDNLPPLVTPRIIIMEEEEE